MKRLKKAVFLLTFILITSLLFSCGNNVFSLEHDSNISTNLTKLTKIKENTKVVLTIDVPEGKVIDYLLFNEQKLTLLSNIYVFEINEDVVVKAYFKDDFELNYYTLSLPDNVNSDVDDLTKIKKDTLITLTIDLPLKRLLDKLLINEKEAKNIINNTYSFVLTENTVVKAYFIFEDGWKKASLYETLTFGTLITTMEFIKEGHLEANIELKENEEISELQVLLNIDENKEIKEAIGSVNYFYEETNPSINFYYDTLYSYVEYIESEEVVKFSYLSDLLLFKINNLDEFIGEEGNDLTDIEFISTIISELSKILLSNMNNDYLNDNVFLLKKFNRYKFLVIANKEILLNLNGLEDYVELITLLPDFELVLEMYFTGLNVSHLDFDIKIGKESITEVKGNLSYTTKTITKPDNLDDYPLLDSTSYQYNIYLNELTMLDIEVAGYLVDEVIKIFDFNDYSLFEQINISGLYLDKDYLYPLTAEALKENNTNIYIKWKSN